MKSGRRKILTVLCVIAALAILFFGLLLFQNPPGWRPPPHMPVYAAFEQWMLEVGTNAYPNVDGRSSASFAQVCKYLKNSAIWSDFYVYVPGLKPGDPQDLVLLYTKQKTRYKWCADRGTDILAPLQWMVLPPGMYYNDDTVGKYTEYPDLKAYQSDYAEGGLLVDRQELKRRMQKTLEYLKTHNRPDWEKVQEEQTELLAIKAR